MRPHRCGGCWQPFPTLAALEGHACPYISSAPITGSEQAEHRQGADVLQLVPATRGTTFRPGEGPACVTTATSNGTPSPEGGPPAWAGRLIGDGQACDQCHRDLPDLYAVLTPEREYGFCSLACLSLWTRTHLVECRRDVVGA